MASPLVLIGTAWNFYKKQPVLNEIAFWMFFLPVAFMDAFSGMIGVAEAQGTDTADLTSYTAMEIAIVIPLLVALFFFLFWGQACVLTVAKRLVSRPSSTTRNSQRYYNTSLGNSSYSSWCDLLHTYSFL